MANTPDYDIYKAGAVLIRDRQYLTARSKGKDIFVCPGGKLEVDETPEQALLRELQEELSVIVQFNDLEVLGTYYAVAAGNESKRLRMDVFIVKKWQGEPVASSEIAELRWLNTQNAQGVPQGSIFEHDVAPGLKRQNLID